MSECDCASADFGRASKESLSGIDDVRMRVLRLENKILSLIESVVDRMSQEELDVKKAHVLAIIFGILHDKATAGVPERRSPRLEEQKLLDKEKRLQLLRRIAGER